MATASRILTTQTGSLPRPPELTEALSAGRRSGGRRSQSVRAQAAASIQANVDRQIEAGIDIIGDGEQGRVGFQLYVPQRFAGFGGVSHRNPPSDAVAFPRFFEVLTARFAGGEAGVDPPSAVADVRYVDDEEILEDCATLRAALHERGLPPSSGFVTAPSPGIIATTFRNRHYDSYEAYVRVLAQEIRKEYLAIVNSGFVLQVDAPDLAMERTMYFADRPLREFLEAAELHVDALNEAISGISPERVRLHCCWGNHESPHIHDVELQEILHILTRAHVGALGIAFANPRHQHEIAVVGDVGMPDRMRLIAGVVDTTTNYVEHPEVVSQRLQAAVRAMGDAERVIASPDCGFDAFAGVSRIAPDVVWAKLATMREGADRAVQAL